MNRWSSIPRKDTLRSSGPLHVAMFCPYFGGGGGAEKMFRRLAVGFAQGGLTVDFVVVNAAGSSLEGMPDDVRVFDLERSQLLSSAGPLLRYLGTQKPDVLLSTLTHANVLAVWARGLQGRRPRLILREANTLSVEASGSTSVSDRVLPLLARLLYPRSDAVVAVSNGVAVDLVEKIGVPRSLVRTIYNPAFDNEIEVLKQERVEHPWLHDGGHPVVLSVGRLSSQKRYDLLLRAVARVRHQAPVRAIILGQGEERDRLESLARELGVEDAVSLPGYVINPYPYMTHADLYVVSSAWEGFPNTIVEALACGLPVVSTDCPSGPREILDAVGLGRGRYGTIVPVSDVEALSTAILRELSEERDRFALVRRAHLFSSQRAVRSYMDLMHGAGR